MTSHSHVPQVLDTVEVSEQEVPHIRRPTSPEDPHEQAVPTVVPPHPANSPEHHVAPRPPEQAVLPQANSPEHHVAPRPPEQAVLPQANSPEHHVAPRPPTATDLSKNTLGKLGIQQPSKEQIKTILPLHEIVELVCNAPSETKKHIVAEHRGGAVPRYGQKASIARALGMCRNAVLPKKKRMKRNSRQRISNWKKVAVNGFLRRDDNSYTLPDKRHYTKKRTAELGETGERFVVALVDTMRNLHRKFVVETGLGVSFPTFCRARDRKTIFTSVFLKRSVCLCKPHANMGMLLEAVPGLPNSTTELCKLSDEEIHAVLDNLGPENETVRFKRWGKEERKYTKTVKKKKVEYTTTHTVLRKVRISVTDFKLLFWSDLPLFRKHHERVGLQYAAVQQLKSVLPHDHAIVHMDYAENWSTSFMQEIQSAFFGKDQLTLHPMVVYHREREGDAEKLINACFVGVSEVIQHSFPTTLAFILQLLPKIRTLVPDLTHLHLITDSPSSQYRNLYTCNLLVRAATVMGIRATWNWLEAGHGKGPCDGLGGALKGLADRVVKSSGSIQNADEFVEHIAPQTVKISLLRTTKHDVDQSEKMIESWNSSQVHGISGHHQVTVYQGKLQLRPTSCYQECCMEDDLRPSCDAWVTPKLKRARVPRATTSTEPALTTQDSSSDSDSDCGSDREDEAGANEHGIMEETFSSDDDSIDVAALRAVDRQKRRQAMHARCAQGKGLKAQRVVTDGVDGSDVEEDGTPSDEDDVDYMPEPDTPEEAARNADITNRRRRGQVVNELADDGETSSDDWPVPFTMSVNAMLRAGF